VTPSAPDALRRRTPAGTAAGALCLVQALVLVGFAVFYLVELLAGAGSDRGRVMVSVVLILVFAGGLGWLAQLWWSGSSWATTPTILWNVLLVPVAINVLQSSQTVLGVALVVVLVPTILAATLGRVPRRDAAESSASEQAPDEPTG